MIKTGIECIDNVLPNGIDKDKINILGTKASFGKTTIALNILLNRAILGDDVLLISSHNTIYQQHLMENILTHSKNIKKVDIPEFSKTIKGSMIFKSFPHSTSIDVILSYLRGKKFDLIIVDDAQHTIKSTVNTYIPFMSQLLEFIKIVRTPILFTTSIYEDFSTDFIDKKLSIKENIDGNLVNKIMLRHYDSNSNKGVKIGGIYCDNKLRGSITLDYNNFTIR
jgi:hypothetical protein